MKTLSASDITKEVLLRLKAKGFEVWPNKAWTRGKRKGVIVKGKSDILGYSHDGIFTACEVKTIGDEFKPEQREFLSDLSKKGGIALWATQVGSNVVIKPYQP